MIDEYKIDPIIKKAIEEDLGYGDITTDAIVDLYRKGSASIFANERMIIAGLRVFARVFELLSTDMRFSTSLADGQEIGAGSRIGILSGPVSIILKGERVALNLLQRMCGIATITKRYVDSVSYLGTKILDTRKTVPGLRILDKYAVRVGGGFNHRMGLYDGIIIKDNHIKAAGSITEAVRRVKENAPHTLRLEIEVETLEDVKEAIEAGVDIIMLDNMSPDDMKKAVIMGREKVMFEASGGIDLHKIREIALTGVHMISIGALTHSMKSADISLELD